jgi:hypothetical protein
MSIFPAGRITPYGIQLLKSGAEPFILYVSADGEATFFLHGGPQPFPGVTEGVILAEGMQGLHPIFSHLDHKGARQDGATWTDTVYDPAEIQMKLVATARTPEGLRRVIRQWYAAWDPENPGTLYWVTPDAGVWSCKPRLYKAPPEKRHHGVETREWAFTWTVRNDDAFWESVDSVSEFSLDFEAAFDDFNRDGEGTLGVNWAQTYTGPGGGVCTAEDTKKGHGRARWTANDPDTTFTGRKSVVIGPKAAYSTPGHMQKITIQIANTPEFTPGAGAANHIWGRMGRNPDGTWNGDGVRATVGWGFCQISAFIDFEETVLDREFVLIPPLRNDVFSFYCGTEDDPFELVLKRNDHTIVNADGYLHHVADLDHLGVGFGLSAGGAILTQATPAQVKFIRAGGNSDGINIPMTDLDNFATTTTTGLGGAWPLYYTGTGPGYVRAVNGNTVWVDTALGRKCINRWLGASEVQTVEIHGSPLTWNLTYNGSETTSSISHPATADTVRLALEALPSIAIGDVAVSNPVTAGGVTTYQVSFQGAYAKQRVPEMKGAALTGGIDPYVQVYTSTDGAPEKTDTDFQVHSITIGDLFQFPFPDAAFIDVWGRRDTNDAAPTGIRLRIGPQWVRLSAFVAGVEVWNKQQVLPWMPYPGESWSLVCGRAGEPRTFVVRRHGSTLFTYKEKGTASALGVNYRRGGFGMESGDGTFSQKIPPSVLDWRMGDNAAIKQSGYLNLTNFGDQPAHPTLVVYGPGTFRFSNGAGTDANIVFGPLKEGEIALIETHPGKRGVYQIPSGAPKNDKLYSLLKGRWSKPIPARNLGSVAETVQMTVEIEGGDYDSRVIASITPKRRWPD